MDTEEAERPRVSASEADELLVEQQSSGLSIAAFAKAKGIPSWSLYNARSRARRKASREFTEVAIAPARETGPSAPWIELALPSGITVRVPHDFEEVALRRLLGVLATC